MAGKKTSQKVSTIASDTLRNPNSSVIQKQLAGSDLAQTNTNKRTSTHMEKIASKVLKSPKYSDTTKTLAGSVLAQSNKNGK